MILTSKDYFLFSGGEVHCKYTPMGGGNTIVLLDYSMNGLMALAQQVQMWRRNHYVAYIDLILPYLPYARQDRWIVDDEPFSLKIYCDMINSLKFNSVKVWDCHSDVGMALLDNCWNIPQWEIARKAIPEHYLNNKDVLFVSPDAGAYKKLSKLIPQDERIIIGVKKRDEKGNIIQTGTYSPQSLLNKTCVIVDDICDGGRTFIELANVLKSQGAKEVLLYVTHGIFSKGLEPLQEYIDHVYTTNSFKAGCVYNDPSFVTVREMI